MTEEYFAKMREYKKDNKPKTSPPAFYMMKEVNCDALTGEKPHHLTGCVGTVAKLKFQENSMDVMYTETRKYTSGGLRDYVKFFISFP